MTRATTEHTDHTDRERTTGYFPIGVIRVIRGFLLWGKRGELGSIGNR